MSDVCVLCFQTRKVRKSQYIRVASVDVEDKIKQGFHDLHGFPFPSRILNGQVHRNCYW